MIKDSKQEFAQDTDPNTLMNQRRQDLKSKKANS